MHMLWQPALAGTAYYNGLIADVVQQLGVNAYTRTLARLHEACVLYQLVQKWLSEINLSAPFSLPVTLQDGIGIGLNEAPRGALMHMVDIQDGTIARYHIMAPTLIHMGVYNQKQKASAIENALMNLSAPELHNPVEVDLVIKSFEAGLKTHINFYKKNTLLDTGNFVFSLLK